MEKIFAELKNIDPVVTAHQRGSKFVFLKNEDTNSAITQFALGELAPGESTGAHAHKTMEECFYFLSGEGVFVIGGIEYTVGKGSFTRVPAGVSHTLSAKGEEKLSFVYYGVAV